MLRDEIKKKSIKKRYKTKKLEIKKTLRTKISKK